MTQLDGFLSSLRPLLDTQGAHAAWIFGSHARGTASAESDIDVIVGAPTDRPFVERFRDYLPAIAGASAGVDLLVYTPDEFAGMQAEERPFLVDALADAIERWSKSMRLCRRACGTSSAATRTRVTSSELPRRAPPTS